MAYCNVRRNGNRMKYFKQLGIIIAGFMWLATPLQADQVSGLYEARVPVESQARDARDVALKTALHQVLVRVTGRRNVLAMSADLEQQLDKAPRFVQQFRYQSREAVKEGEPSELLWVRFDKRAVDQVLREHRLPVWGSTRPATLVWLVIDDRRTRELLSNDMQTPARQVLMEQASLRGIPLRLPLMDLTDRSAVSISDVWGNFEDNLLQASKRYDAEAVLAGRVAKTSSGGWTARWTLYQDGRSQEWNASGHSLEETISPAVNQLADALAEQFAHLGQNDLSEKLRARITGVRNLADYNRVVNYLNGLSIVEGVSVEQLESDTLVLILTSRQGRLAINQAVSLGHTLKPETLLMDHANQPGFSLPVTDQGNGGNKNDPTSEQNQAVDLQYQLLP
jgi:hypothetical protein